MPQSITPDTEGLSIGRAQNGGWVVIEIWPEDPQRRGRNIAALSDDQALIEWLADQLAMPVPEIERKRVRYSADFFIAEELHKHLESAIAGFDLAKKAFEAGDPLSELAVRLSDLTKDLQKACAACAKLEVPF